jgi:PIN domain nuclease of toxin-antitoxin system
MNKYLLDTHTLIWAIVDNTNLSEKALNILQNNENILLVSAVSFWEIAIKHSKGKLDLENFQIQSIPDYCRQMGVYQISLEPLDALNSLVLPLKENHQDPFDRMLIYQCIRNGYTLISRDSKMKFYKDDGLNCIW